MSRRFPFVWKKEVLHLLRKLPEDQLFELRDIFDDEDKSKDHHWVGSEIKKLEDKYSTLGTFVGDPEHEQYAKLKQKAYLFAEVRRLIEGVDLRTGSKNPLTLPSPSTSVRHTLRWIVHRDRYDDVMSSIEDRFEKDVERFGAEKAQRLLWKEVIGEVWPSICHIVGKLIQSLKVSGGSND